jgi:hypothetical protein
LKFQLMPVVRYLDLPAEHKAAFKDDPWFGNDRGIQVWRDQYEGEDEVDYDPGVLNKLKKTNEFLFEDIPDEYDRLILYISW